MPHSRPVHPHGGSGYPAGTASGRRLMNLIGPTPVEPSPIDFVATGLGPANGATAASPTPAIVILLHGFAGFAFMNRPLTHALRRAGYRPVEMGYDSWGHSLDRICDDLAPQFARLDESAQLHIVAHSMGGLVARALIHRHRPARLGRVVMLGTPNGGSEVADLFERTPWLRPILGQAAPALVTQRPAAIEALFDRRVDYDLGIVAGSRPLMTIGTTRFLPSPNDGKVSVASTRLPGAADHIILPLAHSQLPYHGAAHEQIRHFLEHGRFSHRTEAADGRGRSR